MQEIAQRLMTSERYVMYKEMEELCSQLSHPPPFNIGFLDVAAIDLVTKKIDEDSHIEQEFDSFLRNYSSMYVSQMCAVNATSGTFGDDGVIDAKNVAGATVGSTIDALNPRQNPDWTVAGFGDADAGIVLGRGVTGFSFNDFTMDIPIDHGIGLNEMLHYGSFNPQQTWDGGLRQWTTVLTRYFINRSGAAISVTEVGMKGDIRSANVLVARDVLGSAVVINDDKACKVTYTFVSSVWPS